MDQSILIVKVLYTIKKLQRVKNYLIEAWGSCGQFIEEKTSSCSCVISYNMNLDTCFARLLFSCKALSGVDIKATQIDVKISNR